MKHKEPIDPIFRSEELNTLYQTALDAHCSDNSELQTLLEPCMIFVDNSHYGAQDGIALLTTSSCKLPRIVELDDGTCGAVWTLLPEKRIRAILTKTIADETVANEEQEAQDAEAHVECLEIQLAQAKAALATKAKAKGSKTK